MRRSRVKTIPTEAFCMIASISPRVLRKVRPVRAPRALSLTWAADFFFGWPAIVAAERRVTVFSCQSSRCTVRKSSALDFDVDEANARALRSRSARASALASLWPRHCRPAGEKGNKDRSPLAGARRVSGRQGNRGSPHMLTGRSAQRHIPAVAMERFADERRLHRRDGGKAAGGHRRSLYQTGHLVDPDTER